MTDKEKEAIERLKLDITKPLCYREQTIVNIEDLETVLNLVQTQQEKIEYYKKQKDYDDQFKHELLETIRCKSLEIDSLNKILDDRLIRIQGGRGLYAKLRGLDKEYLIREYLSMYKMRKAEIEKKNKIIDEMANYIDLEKMDFECSSMCIHEGCIEECIKEYFINKVKKENKDDN